MSNGEGTLVSAPGRLVLFGEHAVDFGEPAVALAIDLRARCRAQLAPRFTVNGEDLEPAKHPLVRAAVLHGWTDMDRPLAFSIDSDVPTGLGGSAATIVACLGAISMLHDHIIYEQVAHNSFRASCEITPGESPLDTSISTHGGGVIVRPSAAKDELWTLRTGERVWRVSEVRMPVMELVLGFVIGPQPADVRGKVARYCERNSFARDIMKDIGRVTMDGFAALENGDLVKVGEHMNRNQRLLANLGASNPALEKLLTAASRFSYGAKVTGHGEAGAIVALTREPDKAALAIEQAGGKALRVQLAKDGVRPDD